MMAFTGVVRCTSTARALHAFMQISLAHRLSYWPKLGLMQSELYFETLTEDCKHLAEQRLLAITKACKKKGP